MCYCNTYQGDRRVGVNWLDTVVLNRERGRVAVSWFDTVLLTEEGEG